MKYCRRCVTPETRPNISFDAEGVCNACRTHERRSSIDWSARVKAFREVVARARARSVGYDCVIPVSGGKDSTWQTVVCLEHGLNPLGVTWKTPARTAIGARNLENLVSLGVDHIDYQVNPKVERRFLYRSFVRSGSTAIPMHLAIFSMPLRIASRFDIPLVVWGENSAVEYGSDEQAQKGFQLDSAWVRRFGVTQGTTARDWISDDLSARDLTPYFAPSDEELDAKGILAVFLGHYFPWDPATSLATARAHSFQGREQGPKTGYYDYADIDDDFISIHHWLKWYKFGFTRTFDNLSLEIRNGRMTRDAAIDVIRRRGDETPHEDIDRFCAFVGITRARFFEVAERFRDRKVWVERGGRWMIEGFIVADRTWS